MPTNASRAARARALLAVLEHEYHNGAPRDNVVDFLVDLYHLLGDEISLADAHRVAHHHYCVEYDAEHRARSRTRKAHDASPSQR